jgi:F0F1-type ATP synthase membrane subunit b/b'
VITFLFEAANFLVLAAVLGWIFFKPIRQALADRGARLIAEDQQADAKLADANRIQQDIIEARSGLQRELDDLRNEKLEAVRSEADQIIADARATADRELEASRRQAARLSETEQARIAQAAVFAAAETVGRLLRQIASPELHTALLRSACQQLHALPQDRLKPVTVETAEPFGSEDRAVLDEALGPAAAGADVRTNTDLGVGVRVSTGQGLIDASAAGLSGFARQALLKQLNHGADDHLATHTPQSNDGSLRTT